MKVLILMGDSNHDWRATTLLLREILERTGKFDIHINEEVRGNTLATFSPYDVLLLEASTRHPVGRHRTSDYIRTCRHEVAFRGPGQCESKSVAL
jgi:hypothetical protein